MARQRHRPSPCRSSARRRTARRPPSSGVQFDLRAVAEAEARRRPLRRTRPSGTGPTTADRPATAATRAGRRRRQWRTPPPRPARATPKAPLPLQGLPHRSPRAAALATIQQINKRMERNIIDLLCGRRLPRNLSDGFNSCQKTAIQTPPANFCVSNLLLLPKPSTASSESRRRSAGFTQSRNANTHIHPRGASIAPPKRDSQGAQPP